MFDVARKGMRLQTFVRAMTIVLPRRRRFGEVRLSPSSYSFLCISIRATHKFTTITILFTFKMMSLRSIVRSVPRTTARLINVSSRPCRSAILSHASFKPVAPLRIASAFSTSRPQLDSTFFDLSQVMRSVQLTRPRQTRACRKAQ